MKSDPVCIDISHWQTTPPWAQLKAEGIKGVILKCTESTNYVDPTFKARYKAAKDAGLAVSSYHFLRPTSPTAQMDFYLKTLSPELGERVVIDHEDKAVPLTALKAAVQRIIDVRPDLQITIYSGFLIKEQLGTTRDPLLAEKTSLWLAQYTTGSPTWPKETWPFWSLWQYSDKGSVAGWAPIDVNRFNGDDAAFMNWFTPTGRGPDEAVPDPAPPVVTIPDIIESHAVTTLTIAADSPVTLKIKAGPNVTLA